MEEGGLLGEALHLDADVATDSEAMLDARVQVDLIGLLGVPQNGLRLVTLLGRENGVCLSGGDGKLG